jgi:hypothetical protein
MIDKEKIKEIQKYLKEKLSDSGLTVDGDFGPKTYAALKRYFDVTKNYVTKPAITSIGEKTVKAVESILPASFSKPVEPSFDANTLKGKERPLYAKKVLMDLGWKDYQAAALVGQFMQESYSDLRTNVWGDKKTAFGIAQWRDNYDKVTNVHTPGRLTDLLTFANERKKPLDDLDTQVRFVDWELRKGSERGTGKLLAATKNIEEALDVAIGYERPFGWKRDNPRAGHGFSRREAFAKSIL